MMGIAIDPNVRAVLLKVRDEILTDESRWCKGAFARTGDGISLNDGEHAGPLDVARDPNARSWCLDGACLLVGEIYFPRDLFTKTVNGPFFWEWHDSVTFTDVRALLDEAIGAES